MKTTDKELLLKAHQTLDLVRSGHYVKPWLIDQCLRLTGDLERGEMLETKPGEKVETGQRNSPGLRPGRPPIEG